jgi:serine/threonine protein phosphatase PrpC
LIADGTGCTANILLITPTKYYVANAGDSRAVLSRNGAAIALS